jgi:3-oxoadipate enol-lactonase
MGRPRRCRRNPPPAATVWRTHGTAPKGVSHLRADGRSDRPSRGYRLEDFTSDLRELLDGIGVTGPVHLVGNSFGGTVAVAFAGRYPERVRSIVAIESEPPTAAWSEKMAHALNAVLDEMEAERFLAWVTDTYGQHHARLTLSAAKIIRATSIVEDVPSGPIDEAALAAFTLPVLSVLGSEGFQSEDLYGVERLIPDCRTEVIAGQDHSVLVERHHELRPLLLDWIAQHEPAMSGGSR